MEKIKTGDIVVSMITQSTCSGSCPIPMGYVSKAIVNGEYDNESVIWFEETTSGQGNYPIENFRLATKDEIKGYQGLLPYVISLKQFTFYIGQRVITESKGIGTVVGISSDSTDPSYLVALDAFETGHSGAGISLFIGSNKSITNYNGWYFQATSLKPIGTTTQALSGTVTGTATGALSGTGQTYGYGVSGLAGHSTLGSSAGFPGFNGINQYPVETTISETHKEAHKEAMLKEIVSRSMSTDLQPVLSDKEDVKHQDAIILKSRLKSRSKQELRTSRCAAYSYLIP